MTCSIKGCDKVVSTRTVCSMHYQRMRLDGTLDDLPRKTLRGADLLEDYDFVNRTGEMSVRQAAERMGVSLHALRQALYRRKVRQSNQREDQA